MRYALNENNEKSEPKYSGERALCPSCKRAVTGKIYNNRQNHWAHLKKDCDNWYEAISDWHLYWQNLFPKENQEITLFDEVNNEFHRADIRLDNGLIIEVQNSPIVIKEVAQREKFYNKDGLIWILNANNLIPKSSLLNYLRPEKCEIIISFSNLLLTRYSYTDDIINKFLNENSKKLKFLGKKNSTHSTNYIFSSCLISDVEWDKKLLENSIESLSNEYYYIKPTVEIKVINEKYILTKFLAKTQWRKFIDEMKSPVFLDNVTDLHSDYLYWLQKDRVIKKDKFIKKYLSYTKHTVANTG